jgi:hypothetical protein
MARRNRLRSETVPSAPKGQPPGVRELLRMLIEDARLRVRQAQAPKYRAPEVPAKVQRLYRQHQQHGQQIKDLNKVLQSLGYGVQSYQPYALVEHGNPEGKHNQQFEATRNQRLAEIRRLHQQALLDMLSLQGRDAKAYLESLRVRLEGD